jgi:RND family efflux transporter MFP subunit
VYVVEGGRAAKGQLLATIDDPDARASLAQARGQVEQADAALATARAKLLTLKSGSRPEQVAQAKQAVMQAQANLDLAKTNLARQQQLFQEGFIPRATLDQAQTQYEVSLAQLRSAQQQLQLLQAGPLATDVAAAEADVRHAYAALVSAGASEQSAQERFNEGFIRAPISGLVAKRAIEVGQTVIGGSATSGTSVFTLANVTPLLASVNVDETDIARVRPGMSASITVDSLPDANFAGTVQRISPAGVIVQNVNQYTVTVEITNPSPSLRLGMTLNVDFIVARAQHAMLVPNEAVRGKEDRMVFLVGAQDKLTPRRVAAGITDGRLTEIKSVLEEGQVVYLGPAKPTTQGGPPPTNPFRPNFQRRTSPGGIH